MPARVRKGDMVKVISGKDKGKTGKVKAVEPKKSRVFVEGLNMQIRHRKPRAIRDVQRSAETDGITHQEGPIHISNVMPLDPKSGDPTRIGVERDDSGRMVRVGRRSGERFE
jgi:large subunit ribosomal protein L24